MKRNRFQSFRGMMLGIVLLAAAVPCAVRAQSGEAATPKADADAPKEVTITLEGTFDGRDNFDFEEDTIRLRHMSFQMPTGVTVDGKPWEDLTKPFELGYTPDFAKASIVKKEGRGPVDLTVKQDSFTLMIDDKEASSAPYKVTIAVKNQVPREARPSSSDAARQPEKKAAPAKKWVRDASSSGEILLKLEGNLNGRGIFLFDGDTITYRHESEAEYPRNVTIDDMPWEDLTKPFKLDYDTEAPKAVITSRNGPNTVKLRKSDGKFEIEIDDSVYFWPGYRIVVASRHQADRKSIALRELPIQRPPTDFGMPAMTGFPGLDMNGMPKSGRPAFNEFSGAAPRKESPYQNDPDAPMFTRRYNSFGQIDRSTPEGIWEEGISQRKIILTGQFFGNGTFVFEGDTISYRHETREYPSNVTINEAIWGMPGKPFKLPFRIETADFDLNQTKVDRPVRLTKIGDERFDVFFKDPESPPGSSECFYSITITPKKPSASAPPPVNPAAARRELTPRQIMDLEEQASKLPKASGPSIEGSTDGLDHPDFMVSRPVPMYRHDRRVEIKGTVDQWASFRIQGNAVLYQIYRTFRIGTSGTGPVLKGGKFPSGVTVDGKSWSNLTKPFTLDFTPSVSSEKDVIFRAEQCEIEYANHDDVIEFTITNKGSKPVPFEVLWLIRDPSSK